MNLKWGKRRLVLSTLHYICLYLIHLIWLKSDLAYGCYIYIYIYTNSVKACLLESGDRLANVKALYTQSRPELELYSLFAINKTDVYNLYVRFIRSRYRSG